MLKIWSAKVRIRQGSSGVESLRRWAPEVLSLGFRVSGLGLSAFLRPSDVDLSECSKVYMA